MGGNTVWKRYEKNYLVPQPKVESSSYKPPVIREITHGESKLESCVPCHSVLHMLRNKVSFVSDIDVQILNKVNVLVNVRLLITDKWTTLTNKLIPKCLHSM